MRRWGWSLLFAALGVTGCDPEGPMMDAGPWDAALDAGSGDAGSSDAGPGDAAPGDAGPDDAGVEPLPGEVLATGVCAGDRQVAVAPDGSRVAWVSCEGDAAVWIAPLPAGAPAARVADARPTTTVELSPDSAWVLWTDAEGTDAAVRRADLSSAAVSLSAAGAVREARFVLVDPEGTPELRLLTRTSVASATRVESRTDADGFAVAARLLDDAGPSASLELVSGSRSTLIVAVETAGARAYRMVPTGGGVAPTTLPIDPDRLVMGPVGMGDTHGIARVGSGLVFVEFATGTEAELEPDGVAPDVGWLVLDVGGQRLAYYLRNGDPTRRPRNGAGASVTLSTADATDLWATPHGDALIYPSGGRVYRLVDGSAPVDLRALRATASSARTLTTSRLALADGTVLRVLGTDGSGATDVEDGDRPDQRRLRRNGRADPLARRRRRGGPRGRPARGRSPGPHADHPRLGCHRALGGPASTQIVFRARGELRRLWPGARAPGETGTGMGYRASRSAEVGREPAVLGDLSRNAARASGIEARRDYRRELVAQAEAATRRPSARRSFATSASARTAMR
ncbi:MAG: hypothetical protein R3B82_09935 [Sandaracinaceae bacterium]